MKIYLQFFRLYYVWFTIGWIAGFWVYGQATSLPGALVVKATLYVLLYFTSIPEARKYWCYFQNNGFSPLRLYLLFCVADFLIFSAFACVLNILLYAGS